ncbi:hypothetical protein KTN05_07835 [Paracoccus sp. Z118]|uniref:COG4223 family protein n=1 Tax=Paracoccus sp. Z118 TaxID=2851017 RepID=UPI001C2BFC64|nr:hypothetical protein [Paracoccus sp. Z118]MBV0891759.1 hypothetical protein [Paracoccus sp. Z118]
MTPDDDTSGSTRDDASALRPRPAEGPVLGTRPADAGDPAVAQAEVRSSPMIDSTLVGEGGGLPPAEPRSVEPGDLHRSDAVMAEVFDEPEAAPAAAVTEPVRPAQSPRPAEAAPAVTPPAASPATAAASGRKERSGSGFVPLLLGGVIAAALGAGAAMWAAPRMQPAAPAVDTAALQAETQAAIDAAIADLRTEAGNAGAEAARAELATQSAAIDSRAAEAATQAAETAVQSAVANLAAPELGPEALQALSETAAAAGADAARRIIAESPASDTPADLNATLTAQAQQLAALDQTLNQLRAAIPDASARLDSQQAAIDELAARPALDPQAIDRLQQVADSVEATQAQLQQQSETAAQEFARIRDEAAQLQTAAQEATNRALTAAAAANLSAALTSGDSGNPAAALGQLEEAGVEVPSALTVDVVPLDQLQAEYDAAARAALSAALESGAAQGGNSFTNFLRAQTGARSVVPREGSDPDAVLSRAGAAVTRGDIPAALAEIEQLPEPAQAAMGDWTARARAWVEARGAVESLTAPASADTSATVTTSTVAITPAPAQPSN